MKKILVCFLYFVFFSSNGYTHDLTEVMNGVLPSITYIRVERFQTFDQINEVTKEVTKVDIPQVPIVGTGFVIDGNNVVTNYHVIAYAIKNDTKVHISFIDNNKQYEAKILGYDKVADVALLEIEGNHPSVIISTCDNLRMGDKVFSISNFYGIGWSGTQGSISSNKRSDTRYPYIKNLQLQLLTGSGSSGGPVFNEAGEVIALNRSIVSMFPIQLILGRNPSMLSMAAFAIRGDIVIDSINRIREDSIVLRVDLGVDLIPFGEDSMYHTNEDRGFFTGIIVLSVDQGVTTTLKTSDLIIAIGGRTFTDPAILLLWLDEHFEEGDVISMEVYRDEQVINIVVTLGVAGK